MFRVKSQGKDSISTMSQNSDNVGYSPMSLARHNPTEVANLIDESAPELFFLMFGPCAIAHLTNLVQRSHNRFSYQYIHLAEIHDRVVGIATLIPAANVNDAADYRQILNFGQQFWLKLVQNLVLRHVLQHDYPTGTFYIGNLAVAADYRNQGIGRQLLTQCIAKVKQITKTETLSSTIFISVDANNTRAQKLYESLGFQVVAVKTIRLLGQTIGSHILSLSIPNQSC